jgi:putative ABC transport system ATP-binding protein
MVALLRALQLAPQILLLDEPTAALDPKSSAEVESLVVDWVEKSPDTRALVWVSHDVEQGDRVATRKISMESGRIVSGG